MAISTFPLNGVEYNAADFSSFFCTRTSGVYAADNFDITVTGSDMQATIGSGMAWMKLSPTSGIAVKNDSDTVLVFDLIELFRCQAVDRVVISMINKGERCAVDKDGKLLDDTRSVLTRRILDRMNRYENYRGESRTLSDIIDLQVADFARFITDGSTFRPYIAKW